MGTGSLFRDHEIVVSLNLHTTNADVQAALVRSGIVNGARIGECLIEGVDVYPYDEDDGDE